jgi:hypothetical protein
VSGCCVHGNEQSGAAEGENLFAKLKTDRFSRRNWLRGFSQIIQGKSRFIKLTRGCNFRRNTGLSRITSVFSLM